MKSRLNVFYKFFGWLGEKGFSTQEVATGMTMAVLVTSIATVSANQLILDAEEKTHAFNAQQMAQATKMIVMEEGTVPHLGERRAYSLDDLYFSNKFNRVEDPSSEDQAYYNQEQTEVIAESVPASGNSRTELHFYVKLVSADGGYTYLDETDITDTDRTDARFLTRRDVSIPSREESR
jgi:hypothetical protein